MLCKESANIRYRFALLVFGFVECLRLRGMLSVWVFEILGSLDLNVLFIF